MQKPGHKTTEFWMTIVTMGLMVAYSQGWIDQDTRNELEPLLIAGVGALYGLYRTIIKIAG